MDNTLVTLLLGGLTAVTGALGLMWRTLTQRIEAEAERCEQDRIRCSQEIQGLLKIIDSRFGELGK